VGTVEIDIREGGIDLAPDQREFVVGARAFSGGEGWVICFISILVGACSPCRTLRSQELAVRRCVM